MHISHHWRHSLSLIAGVASSQTSCKPTPATNAAGPLLLCSNSAVRFVVPDSKSHISGHQPCVLVCTRLCWIKPVGALPLDCQMLQQSCLMVLCSQKAKPASWCRQHIASPTWLWTAAATDNFDSSGSVDLLQTALCTRQLTCRVAALREQHAAALCAAKGATSPLPAMPAWQQPCRALGLQRSPPVFQRSASVRSRLCQGLALAASTPPLPPP